MNYDACKARRNGVAGEGYLPFEGGIDHTSQGSVSINRSWGGVGV